LRSRRSASVLGRGLRTKAALHLDKSILFVPLVLGLKITVRSRTLIAFRFVPILLKVCGQFFCHRIPRFAKDFDAADEFVLIGDELIATDKPEAFARRGLNQGLLVGADVVFGFLFGHWVEKWLFAVVVDFFIADASPSAKGDFFN